MSSTLFNRFEKTFSYGAHTVTLETGVLARQATAAVLVRMDDTVVLVTLVCAKDVTQGTDFLPLVVHYQERAYAAGRIPGGYFKREGRPTEDEILTARMLDRSIRPLFEQDFFNEIQIIASVVSSDPKIDAGIPAMLGVSAVLTIAGLPFKGPVAAARVGYSQGRYILNPTLKQLVSSDLDLVVAGTAGAVLMVESQARELSEEVMLGAVLFGHQEMQVAIQAIKELAQAVNQPAWQWMPPVVDHELKKRVADSARAALEHAYQIKEKTERKLKISELKKAVVSQLASNEEAIVVRRVESLFSNLEKEVVRGRVLSGQSRIDGRDTATIRPIDVAVSVLPCTHGSAVFTRGETQAFVVVTLGTDRDAQVVSTLEGESRETFMLHYNFHPYSVGEVGQVGSPKRREIGHGNLAKRALRAVLPSDETFPYVLRVVSEITESNGSSSMATVCGSSLALMDAGVPLKKPVAGVAMGLIKEGNRFAILSDILGDEDYLGDMDFKVAGTFDGITALQMDIKIDGITREIMQAALHQAKEGRLHILGVMNASLPQSRPDVSKYAPRIVTMRINPEKIRDLIGKGGATIRSITEETGTLIDISDDGLVRISTPDYEACEIALARVKDITADIEIGRVYEGTVVKLTDFGAFVTLLPGRDGLVHVSQISDERVENVADVLKEGQVVRVKVLEVDRQGRIRLTMKNIATEEQIL